MTLDHMKNSSLCQSILLTTDYEAPLLLYSFTPLLLYSFFCFQFFESFTAHFVTEMKEVEIFRACA